MANYTFNDKSTTPPTPRGTLTATLDSVHKKDPANKKLTNFTYSNTKDTIAAELGEIALTGPDSSGNYSGSKQLGGGIIVTGHGAHSHISFTFNPNASPEFTNGRLDNQPANDDGFDWDASSDSTRPTRSS